MSVPAAPAPESATGEPTVEFFDLPCPGLAGGSGEASTSSRPEECVVSSHGPAEVGSGGDVSTAAASDIAAAGSSEPPCGGTGSTIGGDDAPPPAPPPHEEPRAARKRRDLIAEATSTKHLLTHKPYNEHCPACREAKMKEKPHYRGSYNRKTTKFLQRLTADHLGLAVKSPSMHSI